VGGGEGLGVRILLKLRNLTVANSKSHDPWVIERAIRAFDLAAGPTHDEDSIILRHEFAWLKHFNFEVRI
jgi:hypothetical protein